MIWSSSIACSIIAFLLLPALTGDAMSETKNRENHCLSCHSSPGKLIEITRQLAKEGKYNKEKSHLIKGEG